MSTAGIGIEKISLPPRRSAQALQRGLLDFEVVSSEWFADKTVGEGYVASQTLLPVSEYFITLPQYQEYGLQSDWVYQQMVGTIGGYHYFDEEVLKRMDMPSEKQIIIGLAKGRFNVGILELHTARYWAKKLQVPVVIGKLHSHGEWVLRLREERSDIIPRIDQAISELKSSGKIKKVTDTYLSL